MPASDDAPAVLVDTSVAVAMLVAGHEGHRPTLRAIGDRRVGLAGHAVYETFSVLTRLPTPARRRPEVVVDLMSTNFPQNRFLSPKRAASLLELFAEVGISGGAVYDGLIGATALEHGYVLVTRDRRAVPTYRALQVELEVLAH